MAIEPEQATTASPKEDPRVALIKAAIDEIRPGLQKDNGDCEFVEIEGNQVRVKLTGACVMCSLKAATLDGIQAKIVEKTGELLRLVPIATAPGDAGPKAPPVRISPYRPIIKPPVERTQIIKPPVERTQIIKPPAS
jgi:Fe-S cluster biogenesis protein NfuA